MQRRTDSSGAERCLVPSHREIGEITRQVVDPAQLGVGGQSRHQEHKLVEVAVVETNAPATRSKRIETIRARPP